jgi:hypothetical protein
MANEQIEHAEMLIREGSLVQAQRLLEKLLSADPNNLPAWACYVKTFVTTEDRINALKLCLKYNPDNNQVEQILHKLQGATNQQSPAQVENISEIEAKETPIKPSSDFWSFTIIHTLLLTGYIVELYLAIPSLLSMYQDWIINAGTYPPMVAEGRAMFITYVSLVALQWVILTFIASLHMVLRKRQTSVTVGILGAGVLVGLSSVVTSYIMSSDLRAASDLTLGLFFFGLIARSGVGTFLLWSSELITNIRAWHTRMGNKM